MARLEIETKNCVCPVASSLPYCALCVWTLTRPLAPARTPALEKHSHSIDQGVCTVASAVSDYLLPYGLWPARLLCPWDSPGKMYWSRLPCPLPGRLLNPGIKPVSPAPSASQADSLSLSHSGNTVSTNALKDSSPSCSCKQWWHLRWWHSDLAHINCQ